MAFKTILSIVGPHNAESDALAAADVAEKNNAHLDVLLMSCAPPPPIGDIGGLAYIAWSERWQEQNRSLEELRAKLDEKLAARGISCGLDTCFTLTGSIDNETGTRACYAELTLLGPGLLGDPELKSGCLNGTLFQSPTPVILMPAGKSVDLAPKTVVIAWNASIEAGRAVRHAMPILARARDIRIVIVDPVATEKAMGEEPGADIAHMLARHGLTTTVEVLADGGHETGEVLRQHALETGAGLVVMGAYGRSRLRERIFGGVTQTMIDAPGLPVLMAH